jgi:hypothetical protein
MTQRNEIPGWRPTPPRDSLYGLALTPDLLFPIGALVEWRGVRKNEQAAIDMVLRKD